MPRDSFDTDGLVCRRVAGFPETNIAQRHRHHSPDGLEWGYEGSGPADLALNVLVRMLPRGRRKVKLWDGTSVNRDAWAMHQEFKRKIIAKIPRDGGEVPLTVIREWIARNADA